MFEAVIPMVIMTGMFAMIFGIVYIRSRENMAMIEKGLNPRNIKATPKPYVSLKYGLLLIGVGMGLFTAFLIDSYLDRKVLSMGGMVHNNDNSAIYFSLIAIGGGLGLVISYIIEKKHLLDKRSED